MDPVSLAASIITLIAASNATVSGLMRLWGLRHPPAYLDSAINEVTDFKAMLHLIQTAIASTEDSLDNDCKLEIERLLKRAKNRLDANSTFLERLFKSNGQQHPQQPSLRHKARLRELLGRNQQHFDMLRQDLASIKSSLSVILAAAQMRLTPLLLMSIQQIAIVQPGTSRSSVMNVSGVSESSALMEHAASIHSSSVSEVIDIASENPCSNVPSQTPSTASASGSYLRISTKPFARTCSPKCSCRCHIPLQARTPRWLRNVIGTLFLNATGTPLLNYRSCDQTDCDPNHASSESLQFQYFFPTWLLPFGVEVNGSFKHLRGLGATWSIRVPRVMNREVALPVLNAIGLDSVQDLQKILSTHRISIIDRASDYTILQYAIFRRSINVVSNLLQLGFDLDSVDTVGRTHGHYLIRNTIHPRCTLHPLLSTHARQLEGTRDSMDLNALHDIVLGMDRQDLATKVSQEPDLIRGVDALGYTPLHYAARRADGYALDVLLTARAHVNAVSKGGESVLQWAALGGSVACCQKLIDAGTVVGHKDLDGRSALFYARKAPDLMLLLLRNGLEANSTNRFGYTPLMWAAEYGVVETCRHLLDYRADIEAVDIDGRSAIFWAVEYNNVPVVEFLRDEGAVLNRVNRHGWSLIDYAAAWGSPEVMQVLAEARIEGLPMSPDDIDWYWDIFNTERPLRYAGQWEPLEVEQAAFQALLDSIVPCEETQSDNDIDIEGLELPGAFPKESNESRDEVATSASNDEDEDEDNFVDAIDDQQEIETVLQVEHRIHPT